MSKVCLASAETLTEITEMLGVFPYEIYHLMDIRNSISLINR